MLHPLPSLLLIYSQTSLLKSSSEFFSKHSEHFVKFVCSDLYWFGVVDQIMSVCRKFYFYSSMFKHKKLFIKYYYIHTKLQYQIASVSF